ncbi:MAG: MBL fold metallo-hydrolase [Mycobacterium sp.]|uniref:MBL fold metallo-hydrolase n=1 Tax=Mycobacterium sp. TaxID=1785 RepID=UPI001EC51563|nr:MBL fold metallo-hydrolase [Mycobacterium sp.]MBW0019910.1 MBL fold metallo-hydrolase [Mycobacterium sp.]
MKVHHLNCGTMNMPTAPVCHVLLVETDDGLVLVDSGFETADCSAPARRIGLARHASRPVFQHSETAVHQIERLGFERTDVRHIVITHFDFDHVGGISDFPHARVHLTAAEAFGAIHSPSRQEKIRYRSQQWAHRPTLVEHSPDGEPWRGFAAAKELADIAPGIVFIALPGHTRGHACIAVDAGDRWILHAGDAFYHHGALDAVSPIPRALTLMENLVAFDRKQVRANHARLAELYARNEPDLLIVCAHDPELYRRADADTTPHRNRRHR